MDDEIFYRDKGTKAEYAALFLQLREFEVLKWNTLPFETRLAWLIHWADQSDRFRAYAMGSQENKAGLPELQALIDSIVLDEAGGDGGLYWCGRADDFRKQSAADKLSILRDAVDTYFATARMLSVAHGAKHIAGEARTYLESQHSRVADMLDAVMFDVQ